MERVLIVSASERSQQAFAELFSQSSPPSLTMVSSGSAARRLLMENEYDLLLINTPLRDEFGQELAIRAARSGAGVLLVVKAELEEEIAAQVEDYGVFVLTRPLARATFYQSIKLLHAAQKRIDRLLEENRRLREKIEELRIVERAKYVLIEHLGFSEEQAHRYIEKQAMDRRMTRRGIAEGILNTYEM